MTNCIYDSLSAIKGVGEAAVDHIVEARGNKPFASLEDFCLRTDPKLINRRVWESLIAAGALDCFGHDRASLVASLDRIVGYGQRAQMDKTSGQSDMFGAGAASGPEKIVLAVTQPWLARNAAQGIPGSGLLSQRPSADAYRDILARMRVQSYAELPPR